jgi:two-component system response regulator TctD
MRLLLVEDNVELATWLVRALTQSGFAVDLLGDGALADAALADHGYDAVILDYALPRLDGLGVLRRLRARRDAVPVLMLTAHGQLGERVAGLDAGADDYLTKPFALAELEARLRALLRRSSGKADGQVTCGNLVYDVGSRRFFVGDAPLALTPREHAVLETLVLRAGKPANKNTLTQRVFSSDDDVNPDAIEIYVHRLRKKLTGAGAHIVTLRGLGYLLEPDGA